MHSSLSTGKIILLSIFSFCLLIAIVGCVSVSTANKDRVIMGVQSMGTSLSGMKKEDAKHFFEKTAENRISQMAILLQYGEKTWTIKPEEIHLHGNIDGAVENAYSVGREGTALENLISQLKYAITGRSVEFTADYDRQLLSNKLQEIANAVNTSPVNASIDFQPDGSLKHIPCVIGKTLDTKPIADALEPQLLSFQHPKIVVLEPADQPPAIVDADLAPIDSVLASYTTDFYYGDRGDNIVIAASHLDNILVRSNTVFSFNNTVGQRTASAGYKDAPVIIDGKTEQDVGGGVCQVSSTLYNAVLLAGLTPTLRTPHFYPSAYCPPGRDATVADGLLDFQFMNQLPHNVYLLSRTYGDCLTIYVLGAKSDLQGNTISLESEGSRMHPTIYRIYTRDGEVIDREYMHTDSYDTPTTLD